MVQMENILYRRATIDDAEALIDFIVTNIGTTSPICKALKFDLVDCAAMYSSRVLNSLADGISVLAIDEASSEIVGYRLASFWYRDPAKNLPISPKATHKAQILSNLSERLRAYFWELCPPEIDCVVRRESSCVRSDFQRRGIGKRLLHEFFDEQLFKYAGIGGAMSVTTSFANQCLLAKDGYVPLAEMSYDEYFFENGLSVDGAFDDKTSKAVLNFKEF
ncbi:hypothetical protein QR680_013205 [Steinernema hermaphroditum]|uniref:N-acetyltransferase domain-containing protein n=1 Tax=Steinernema hermaphroditum TaxID=289476 RepID=A0AA39I7A9_9BILA|nr:hypothetical protein QR680_013205 [Steinernema hermaphroditum]